MFASEPAQKKSYVILVVWDGLRPDALNSLTTPYLYSWIQQGVIFQNHHAGFPTLTTINAAILATGKTTGTTGFFGNTLWLKQGAGQDSTGKQVDFRQPIFTDDYKILQSIYARGFIPKDTLFQTVRSHQLSAVFVGNSGAALLFDPAAQGIIVDEYRVHPLSFAKILQQKGYVLPSVGKVICLSDGVTPDPTDKSGSPYAKRSAYFTNVYLNEILPRFKPDLSVLWLPDPDGTEHDSGLGSFNYQDSLRKNDKLLGQLLKTLRKLGIEDQTDLLIISDHAQSSVSGPLLEFPVRNVRQQKITNIQSGKFSVSGDVRVADLLKATGFIVFDGEGCRYDPILSGIKANAQLLYPRKTSSFYSGAYTTCSFKVPTKLPSNAVIIATNGGSDYFYLPSKDQRLMEKLVYVLQSNEVIGSLFVNEKKYSHIPGTFSLKTIDLQSDATYTPDLIASLNFDANAMINGIKGTEFDDYPNERGSHGAFTSVDVHNFFAARGPHFAHGKEDRFPTGNIDIAPTIAYLLGLTLPHVEGRIVYEALQSPALYHFTVKKNIHESDKAMHLKMQNALKQPMTQTHYKIVLREQLLLNGQKEYHYFDEAKAVRW